MLDPMTGELLPFKRGAFKLAVDSGALIIPCYIDGSRKIVQKKSLKHQSKDQHEKFMQILKTSKNCGLLVNERIVNLPFQCG